MGPPMHGAADTGRALMVTQLTGKDRNTLRSVILENPVYLSRRAKKVRRLQSPAPQSVTAKTASVALQTVVSTV